MELWKFAKESGVLYDINMLERKKSKTKRHDLRDKYDIQIRRLKGLK